MIDFHTHTLLSDGVLLPGELARRAQVKGYRALAITDHVDASNIEQVTAQTVEFCRRADTMDGVRIIPGVELTHVPPAQLKELIRYSRKRGIRLIVVHGETLVEPVIPGTNRCALGEDVDILAHPGLLSKEEAEIAAERGIYVEITTRTGHCLSNGHVAAVCREAGAGILLNTDAHGPGDLVGRDWARTVALGAGLREEEVEAAFDNAEKLLKKFSKKT